VREMLKRSGNRNRRLQRNPRLKQNSLLALPRNPRLRIKPNPKYFQNTASSLKSGVLAPCTIWDQQGPRQQRNKESISSRVTINSSLPPARAIRSSSHSAKTWIKQTSPNTAAALPSRKLTPTGFPKVDGCYGALERGASWRCSPKMPVSEPEPLSSP